MLTPIIKGHTRGEIVLNILADNLPEVDETFFVSYEILHVNIVIISCFI